MRTDEKRDKTFNYITPLASLLLITGVMQSCEKEEPKKNPESDFIEYEASSGEIGSGGGSITISDSNSNINGASVHIPEGALDEIKSIEIKSVDTPTDFLENDLNIAIKLKPQGACE